MTTTLGTAPRLTWCTMLLALVATAAVAAPSGDRKAPTTPTNLRVTGVSAYSVSLAWDPSTDNSGQVRYKICCADVNSQEVEGPASTAVYTAGIRPSRSFSLRIWAVDPSGNFSKASNAVTFTTPADTTPPTTPRVSVIGVGPTHVALHFSSVDEGPLWYNVLINGAPLFTASSNDSPIVPLLKPETTYAFTVRARDFAGNLSPGSETATVTTPAPNPDDVTPPTTPTLVGWPVDNCEVHLDWTESTDDLDPQFVIEYEIYVNGEHDHSLALRFTKTSVYATRNGVNTFAVAAVDSAGNRSELSEEVSGTFDGCEF
jgi:chitodextrinase